MRYLAIHAFSSHAPLEGQGGADGLVVVDALSDDRFDRMVEAMPEVKAVLETVGKRTVEEGAADAADAELVQLRESVRVLQTSYAVSMIQLVSCLS